MKRCYYTLLMDQAHVQVRIGVLCTDGSDGYMYYHRKENRIIPMVPHLRSPIKIGMLTNADMGHYIAETLW